MDEVVNLKKRMLGRHAESVCVKEEITCAGSRIKVDLVPGGGGLRRWDEMHKDILVQIFLRIPTFLLLLNIPYVCRSWFSSVLDALFPSGMLNLRKLTFLHKNLWSKYLRFLQISLDTRPLTQWRILIYPAVLRLKEKAILYIAERSPCLQVLFVERTPQLAIFQKAFPCWKNLRRVSCMFFRREIISVVWELSAHCKNVSHLGLHGRIGTGEASAVVKSLPQLEYLSLEQSTLTVEAFLILDSHKKLATLNLQHCLFVDVEYLPSFVHGNRNYSICLRTTAKDWNQEIRQKVLGNKQYFRCKGRLCDKCHWAYLPIGTTVWITT